MSRAVTTSTPKYPAGPSNKGPTDLPPDFRVVDCAELTRVANELHCALSHVDTLIEAIYNMDDRGETLDQKGVQSFLSIMWNRQHAAVKEVDQIFKLMQPAA